MIYATAICLSSHTHIHLQHTGGTTPCFARALLGLVKALGCVIKSSPSSVVTKMVDEETAAPGSTGGDMEPAKLRSEHSIDETSSHGTTEGAPVPFIKRAEEEEQGLGEGDHQEEEQQPDDQQQQMPLEEMHVEKPMEGTDGNMESVMMNTLGTSLSNPLMSQNSLLEPRLLWTAWGRMGSPHFDSMEFGHSRTHYVVTSLT